LEECIEALVLLTAERRPDGPTLLVTFCHASIVPEPCRSARVFREPRTRPFLRSVGVRGSAGRPCATARPQCFALTGGDVDNCTTCPPTVLASSKPGEERPWLQSAARRLGDPTRCTCPRGESAPRTPLPDSTLTMGGRKEVEPVRALPQVFPALPSAKIGSLPPRRPSASQCVIDDQKTDQLNSTVRSPITLQLEARVEAREQVCRVQWHGGLRLCDEEHTGD
jgi:hypothetical protein